MPQSTELPSGDLYEFVGNFRLNGDGPPTTGRMTSQRLQEVLLGSTSLVGVRVALMETRISVVEAATGAGGGGAALAAKINDAIAKAAQIPALSERIDGKADQSALDEIALAAEQAGVLLAPYKDLVGSAPDRPGDGRTLFTRDMTGDPKSRPPIDRGMVEDGGELGQVLRITGADIDPATGYIDVAPRRAYYMQKDRTYLVQYAFARHQDPVDPLNHAVELRLQMLGSDHRAIRDSLLGYPYAPKVADGPFFIDTFIGKKGAPGTINYIVPDRAAYSVPYFRVYGNGHETDLGAVRLYDVTFALAGGADVASILARVKKLEEGQLAGVTYAASWDDLASRPGKVDGAGAEVPDSDTGTHTDPVSGEARPNAGRYSWSEPAQGWLWVSVTTARQAADFVGESIPTSTIATAPTLELAFRDPVTKRLTLLSPADTKTFIQGLAMDPITYSSEPPGLTAELTSKVILPPDDQRKNFQVQCETHDLAVNWSGRAASFERDAIVYAGVIPDWSAKGKEAVSVIARPSALRSVSGASIPAKVWVSQDRLVPGYISGSLFADTVLSNYPDQGLERSYRAVLRDEINKWNDAGIWAKFGIFLPPIHTRDNLLVNLRRPDVPMVLVPGATKSGVSVDPYRSTTYNGVDCCLDTVLLPADSGLGPDSHLFALQTKPTVIEGTGVLAGNGPTYYIKPNAGTSGQPLVGFRSTGGQDAVGAPLGSWVAMNRISTADYDRYVEETKVGGLPPRPGEAPGQRSILIGACNSGDGPVNFSKVPLMGLAHGFGLQTQVSVMAVREGMKKIFAAAELAATS